MIPSLPWAVTPSSVSSWPWMLPAASLWVPAPLHPHREEFLPKFTVYILEVIPSPSAACSYFGFGSVRELSRSSAQLGAAGWKCLGKDAQGAEGLWEGLCSL